MSDKLRVSERHFVKWGNCKRLAVTKVLNKINVGVNKITMKTIKQKKSKTEKREEALKRQEAYNKLSTEEKVKRIGNHRAVKQRKKLQRQLELEGNGKKKK